MAPLQLEGETLGLKQKNFNILVEKKIKEGSAKSEKLNPDGSDVENLFAIEIACKTKNLPVILDVLRSEDMLYVSRAIRHSTWLVTDPQYAHIINPEYLHAQLFPHMTVKACNKLLLHIRLHLKDEARVDEFYTYVKNKDQMAALKWLPHCSLNIIMTAVEEQNKIIKTDLLKRLCEKSITVLETFLKNCEYMFFEWEALKKMTYLVNKHTEIYLDLVENIVDKVDDYDKPSFGPKATKIMMKICPDRIIDNFEKYCKKIDLQMFAKHLKGRDVKDFLFNLSKKDKMKDWLKYHNLKHFVRYIPIEGRFEFLKSMFIDKSYLKDEKEQRVETLRDAVVMICRMSDRYAPPTTSANISLYRWYKFAPFQTAFTDLKNLIRSESSLSERNTMLAVLLTCANRNPEHINELLQYFHDKHINVPFKFKLQFVNMVITQTNTWNYDEKAWNNLNNIFHSMEVYTESDHNVQTCVHCIIVKKVLLNEKVPEIIEKKFTFSTLKNLQKKLNAAEINKIFNYLSNILLTKIKNVVVQNESDFAEIIQLLEQFLTLIVDYNKELADFPNIVAKIKKLAHLKAKNSWYTYMTCLFDKKNSWRRCFFDESLIIYPSEGACLNALKHDPALLSKNAGAVAELRRNDAVSLSRVLVKLRVYWRGSLASEWASEYLAQLEGQGAHRATVRGLCTLLPHKQLLDIIKKYEPNDTKIKWSVDDEILLSLRKQIAKNMYIARPAPPPDAILPFARGDYLQFALPSLNAILHNIPPMKCREYIPKLLAAPVSLRKHGIRLVTKIESVEVQKIFSDLWKSTKNLSIRAILFKQTFQLLCNEKNQTRKDEIWHLLEMFIDNLSQKENRIIYDLLASVEKVPLQVRAKYCMKAYAYLKSLPPKCNCDSLVVKVINCTRDIMESLEPSFVSNILQETLEKTFTTKVYDDYNVMSAFLLCTKDSQSQNERFEKLLAPLLDKCLGQWESKVDGKYVVKNNVTKLLKQLSGDVSEFAFEKKMALPVQLFASIQEKLEAKLPMQSNYVFVKTWAMTVNLVKILEDHKSMLSSCETKPPCNKDYGPDSDKRWERIYLKVAPLFAAYIVRLLKDEMKQYFPSIYMLLGKAVEDMIINMIINKNIFLEIYINILNNKDFAECCLLVLTALPEYLYGLDEDRAKFIKIHQSLKMHPSVEVKMHYYLKYNYMDGDMHSKSSFYYL